MKNIKMIDNGDLEMLNTSLWVCTNLEILTDQALRLSKCDEDKWCIVDNKDRYLLMRGHKDDLGRPYTNIIKKFDNGVEV